jgi:hypothetical protein
MTQGQGQVEHAPRYCPRCGGLMQKPSGSTLYWHADNNHPRCDITNIVDAPIVVQTSEEPLNEPPKGKGHQRKNK